MVLNQYITTATFTIICNWITLLQDARLTEGVRRYKEESWARVVEFMGDGLTARQCYDRWSKYLKPLQIGLTRRNWQPDEVPHPYYCSNLYIHTISLTDLLVYCRYSAC